MNRRRNNRAGFTLAELLISIGIIAVLIAICIPVFSNHLERTKETTDYSNMRSAIVEVVVTSMANDDTATHDGQTIKQADGSYRVEISPLKQSREGWQFYDDGVMLGNVKRQGRPTPHGCCSVIYDPDTAESTIIYGSQYSKMPLMQLKNVSNSTRVKEDQKTLQALGTAILEKGWTVKELRDTLGILVDNPGRSNESIRIADYYQLKSGSYDSGYESAGFRITSKENGNLESLLREAGYNSGSIKSLDTRNGKTDTVYNNPLFFSDELGSNKFQSYAIDKTKRSIIINDIKTQNGKISGFTIYTKAMDGQANLNTEQKKQFSLKVSKS